MAQQQAGRDQAGRRGRSWVVPTVLVAVVVLLLAVVVTLRSGNGDQAGPTPQEDITTQEDTTQEDATAEEDAAPQEELPAEDDPAAAPGPRDPLAQGPPAQVEGPPEPSADDVERRDPEDLLATGPVDAPVVLVVFSDYQCPFCAQWSHETLPVMMDHVHAGDLRIEWRDVNLFGDASERAARATYAAALQEGFWDYHHALFDGGDTRPEGQLSDEALRTLAEDLGLDGEQFTADLNAAGTAEEIDRNARLGLDLGAYSTPVFLLGGQPIVGAQPTEVFTAAFDAALAGAGG